MSIAASDSSQRAKSALVGVSGAVVTLFDRDRALDLSAMEAHLARLDAAGLETLLIAGNTGEYSSLTASELEECYRVAGRELKRTPFLAGAGGPVEQAVSLCEAASALGAIAIMVHEPPDPFASPAGVASYYLELAGRSPLGLMLYLRESSIVTNEELAIVLSHPNLLGVKDGRNDLQAFVEARNAHPDAAWLCGGGERWAPLYFVAGARGFTSGLVNVDIDTPKRLAAALEEADFATAWALWRRIAPFEAIRNAGAGEANVTAIKAAMAARWGTSDVVRPPLAPLSSALADETERAVAELVKG